MFSKSKVMTATSAFALVALLGSACGQEKNKKNPESSVTIPIPTPFATPTSVPAETVQPAPTVVPTTTPAPTPIPVPTPVPSATPTPTPEPTPPVAPAPVVENPLPASRDLTAEEKAEYLSTEDFLDIQGGFLGRRGLGFDKTSKSFAGFCVNRVADFEIAKFSILHDTELLLLPLSSTRQFREAFNFEGHSLYLNQDIAHDDKDVLPLLALVRKVRKTSTGGPYEFRPEVANVSEEMFDQRCGQSYQSGEVYGQYLFSVVWIELDKTHTKEAILSRLIDSHLIGKFSTKEAFQKSLQALQSRLADTHDLSFKGRMSGYNFKGETAIPFGFDFGSVLESWSAEAEKVELKNVPEIGFILEDYPSRTSQPTE